MESREIIETRIRNLVMEAFPHFDTGGTGGLNVQQLGPFLGEVLPKLGDTTLDNQDKVLQVLKQFDLNSDGKLSKIELFVAMDTVFKDKALPVEENVGHLKQVPPPSPPSPTIPQQQYEPVQLAPGSPLPTPLDLRLKKLIDTEFLKYDPMKRHYIGINELPFLLNDCFQALALPNRVNSAKDAQEAMQFMDINHDGQIQKMYVFILLRTIMLGQL